MVMVAQADQVEARQVIAMAIQDVVVRVRLARAMQVVAVKVNTMLAAVGVVVLEVQMALVVQVVGQMVVLLHLQEQIILVVVVERVAEQQEVQVSSSFLFLKLNLQSTHISTLHQDNGQHLQESAQLIIC
jgi:hypothetical protein